MKTKFSILLCLITVASVSLGGCAGKVDDPKTIEPQKPTPTPTPKPEVIHSQFSVDTLIVGSNETQKSFTFTFGSDFDPDSAIAHDCVGATLNHATETIDSYFDANGVEHENNFIEVTAVKGKIISLAMNFTSSDRNECSVFVADINEAFKLMNVQFKAAENDPSETFPGFCAHTGQIPSVFVDDWSNPNFKCCVNQSLCTGGPGGLCYADWAPESWVCKNPGI